MLGSLSSQWSSTPHGLTRTTDSYSGNYAGVVSMWYNGAPACLSLGICEVSAFNQIYCKVPVDQTLYGVSGQYKYYRDLILETDIVNKYTELHIQTFRFNLQNDLELITNDSLIFNGDNNYTPFYLGITDTSEPADFISVWFESRPYEMPGFTYCSFAHMLYIDDVQFHYEPLGIEANSHSNIVRVYPNPANEVVFLDYNIGLIVKSIFLYDVSGKMINEYPPDQKKLDISDVATGYYLLRVNTNEGLIFKKILID
jgi:hypothetical protein